MSNVINMIGGITPKQYLDEQTITPGTADQVINAGTYLRGALTVAGDSDLIPANIKDGVEIFGITGTCVGSLPIEFTYTGSYTVDYDVKEVDGEIKIAYTLKLLTSGTLNIQRMETPYNDIFLVGGGGGGARGAYYYKGGGIGRFSGNGGGGGYTETVLNANIGEGDSYQVIIGAGGAGGDWLSNATAGDGGNTSIGNYSANGGKSGNNGSAGGSGGGQGGSLYSSDLVSGTGQGTTTMAFGETTGTLFAGGGGGGSYNSAGSGSEGGAGGSDGANGNAHGTSPSGASPAMGGAGGAGGGGKGGSVEEKLYTGSPGTTNTGGGGGGAPAYSSSGTDGGSGGSGIVIIRGRYI